MEDHTQADGHDLKFSATVTLFAVALSVMAVFLLLHFFPSANQRVKAEIAIVTLDIVRLSNAQRAVASTFIKPSANQGEAIELLTDLPERTRKTIEEVAGRGTLVVLKQAVVQGQTQDITTEVLKRLGLPDAVPTSDALAYTLDVAPTMLLRPPMPIPPRQLPGEGQVRGDVLP